MWVKRRGLKLHLGCRLVYRAGVLVQLEPMGFRLLELLLERDGTVSRSDLMDGLWINCDRPEPEDPDANLRQHTHRLRIRLAPLGVKVRPVYGKGLRLEIKPPERGNSATADGGETGYRENVA